MRHPVRSSFRPARWLLTVCAATLLLPAGVRAGTAAPVPVAGGVVGVSDARRGATADTVAATLLAVVTQRLAMVSEPVGVAVRISTPRGASTLAWDGEARYSAASVIKLAIMAAYEEGIARREWTRDADNDALEEAMIVYSDNDAANELIDLLGYARINATMRRLGMTASTIGAHLEMADEGDDAEDNYLVPRESLLLMEALVRGAVGDGERVRDLLGRSLAPWSVRESLPIGVPVYEKRGWYDGVENDVLMIALPDGASLTLAVFQPAVTDVEDAWALIADLTLISLTALTAAAA